MSTTKLNFWLDVIIGIAFVLALISGLAARPIHGPMGFHVFIGLIMSIGVALHLVLHRKWIAAAMRPGKKPRRLTVDVWLNVLLGVAYAVTLISGLRGHRNPSAIDPLHVAAATSMTIILLVHLARHWKWIVNTGKRYLAPSQTASRPAGSATDASAGTQSKIVER